MFQVISFVSIVVVLVLIAWHYKVFPTEGNFRSDCCELTGSRYQRAKKLGILFVLLCFAGLFLTGFGPRLLLDKTMGGYTLMLHAAIAPIFVILAAFCSVAWAEHCRLNEEEWKWCQRLGEGKWDSILRDSSLGMKLSFWLAVILIIPSALSMILSMFPIFGTAAQDTLFQIHRYTGLALVLVLIVHVYLVARNQVVAKKS